MGGSGGLGVRGPSMGGVQGSIAGKPSPFGAGSLGSIGSGPGTGGGRIDLGGPGEIDFSDEPPLLEELGVNFDHIRAKLLAVVNPMRTVTKGDMDDADLAGPFVLCLALSFLMLARMNFHFGYVFGFFISGGVLLYFVLNLMAQQRKQQPSIDIARTFSLLGYCLLPIVVLAAFAVLFDLQVPLFFVFVFYYYIILFLVTVFSFPCNLLSLSLSLCSHSLSLLSLSLSHAYSQFPSFSFPLLY